MASIEKGNFWTSCASVELGYTEAEVIGPAIQNHSVRDNCETRYFPRLLLQVSGWLDE